MFFTECSHDFSRTNSCSASVVEYEEKEMFGLIQEKVFLVFPAGVTLWPLYFCQQALFYFVR